MPARVLVDLHVVISEAALLVAQRAIDQLFEFLDAERFELKNLRTRDKRAIYIKERIVSGRADKPQISGLNIRQKNVLLRFVEMMNFINEQDRFLSRSAEAIRRRSDDATHFCDVAFHAADSNEFRMGHFRNDPRQRGFAAAGGTGENHRR